MPDRVIDALLALSPVWVTVLFLMVGRL